MFQIIEGFQRLIYGILLIGYDRGSFHYESTIDKFFARDFSRNTYFTILFFGVMAVAPIVSLLNIIQLSNISNIELVTLIILYLLISLIGIRKFLWLINGKESILIEGDNLIHIRSGTFLIKKRVYELSLIDNISNVTGFNSYLGYKQEEIPNEIWRGLEKQKLIKAIFWRFTIGQISFSYRSQKIKLFNKLDQSQIDLIIRELNTRNKQKTAGNRR